jgi:hypothetical protein
LAIVKDEQLYLEEFVCYYLAIGIDHFYFYDNGSTTPIKETLQRYSKWCTIINFPGEGKQLDAYNNFILQFSQETEWVAPFDIDEFIVLKEDENIKAFVKKYSYLDCIAINWRSFGDSFFDKRPDGLVIDNFVWCDHVQNLHIKNIVKTSAWSHCKNVHFLGLRPGSIYSDVKHNEIEGPFNENYTNDIVQLNHYFCKSKEECIRKYKRARASNGEKFQVSEEILESWRNSLNLVQDTFLKDRFSKKVTAMMKNHRKKWLAF